MSMEHCLFTYPNLSSRSLNNTLTTSAIETSSYNAPEMKILANYHPFTKIIVKENKAIRFHYRTSKLNDK